MQFSSRLMVASHILLYLAEYEQEEKVTSVVLANTTGVNSVNIRKILAKLKSAGLVEIKAVMESRMDLLERQLYESMSEMKLSDMYVDMKQEIEKISKEKS